MGITPSFSAGTERRLKDLLFLHYNPINSAIWSIQVASWLWYV